MEPLAAFEATLKIHFFMEFLKEKHMKVIVDLFQSNIFWPQNAALFCKAHPR